ncbi:MAG: hypothetical protein V2G40_02855 [bacterium JZ-2024 1]
MPRHQDYGRFEDTITGNLTTQQGNDARVHAERENNTSGIIPAFIGKE